MTKETLILPVDYSDWLLSLKQRIRNAQQRAVFAANQEQIQLYHEYRQRDCGAAKPEYLGLKGH